MWVAVSFSRGLKDPGNEPVNLASHALAGAFFTTCQYFTHILIFRNMMLAIKIIHLKYINRYRMYIKIYYYYY